MADLADEVAIPVELEQLRRRGGVGVAAVEHEHMALGVDRDPRDLTQIEVVRQLQEVGNRIIRDLRHRLRRIELQSATRNKRFDDPALKSAPGSDAATAALSYAEAEALEDFAEAAPERTCVPLANSPDLRRGDEIVRAFRAQQNPEPKS